MVIFFFQPKSIVAKFFSAVVRLVLPSEEPNLSVRFFEIAASDLDVLLEMHPDRKASLLMSL